MMVRTSVGGLLALTSLLASSTARADLIPSGRKSVKLSIAVTVEGEVPEGRTLLLLNTWEGATKLPPGKAVGVDWHPLHGKMQLVSVNADQLAAIEAIAQEDRSDKRMPKMQAKATACAAPLDGVRTVEDTERYDEIRWHYTVSLDDASCTGKLTRTAYLADGEDLAAPAAASASATSTPATKPTKEAPRSTTPASDPPKAAPPTPASTCRASGPPTDTPGLGGALALLAGLSLSMRVRARRRRAR